MEKEPIIKFSALMIDCIDPHELAVFYAKLIKWEIVYENAEYSVIASPNAKRGAYPSISFQKNENFKPPVWPEEIDKQQQMAHIDFVVDDLEKSIEYAKQCGATVANTQFSEEWTVLFDPAGHPFCLCLAKELIEKQDFALL